MPEESEIGRPTVLFEIDDSAWQLIALRFLMGISLAGLLPSINATIRHNVPEGVAGSIPGYSTSAQMSGQVIGPLVGGFVGGHIGMRAVFLAAAAILFCGGGYNWLVSRPPSAPVPPVRTKLAANRHAAMIRNQLITCIDPE